MKKKRIHYNEISFEIYTSKYWSKFKIILIGMALLVFGFLFNFSLEEKINDWLLSSLSNNTACPIQFEKVELSYFFPKLIIKKPMILGSCFGQPNNTLPLDSINIAISIPSFYPPGIKFHVTLREGKTDISIYPTISLFSNYIDIENSIIDNKLFAAMSIDNKSSLSGQLKVDGYLKFSSGSLVDGNLHISSKNFQIPAQNIKGFEMNLMNLKHLDIKSHFTDKSSLKIDHIEIGQPGSPVELTLKGNISIDPTNFVNSQVKLSGPLKISNFILINFSFIKLFLPAENTSGTYQMNINGTVGNLGSPQIK